MSTSETKTSQVAQGNSLDFLDAPTDVAVMRWLNSAFAEALSQKCVVSGKTMMEWLESQDPPMALSEGVDEAKTSKTLDRALQALKVGIDPNASWYRVSVLYRLAESATGDWLDVNADL